MSLAVACLAIFAATSTVSVPTDVDVQGLIQRVEELEANEKKLVGELARLRATANDALDRANRADRRAWSVGYYANWISDMAAHPGQARQRWESQVDAEPNVRRRRYGELRDRLAEIEEKLVARHPK